MLPVLLLVSACASSEEKADQAAAQAEALLRAGNLPAARQAIGKALSYRDDKPELLLLDALIKAQMQDYGGAYDSYRVVLALDPNNVTALAAVAQLGLATGNIRESREAIDKALAIDPRQPDVLLTKGVHALNRKDYAGAVAIGDQILAFVPDDPRGIVLRARGLFLQGKVAESMHILEDAATRVGNNSMISTALLENARAQGNLPLMMEQFAYLRENNPNSADLAIDETNVRYKSGDLAGARDAAREALAKFGTDADTMSRLYELWLEYDPKPLAGQDLATFGSGLPDEGRLMAGRYLLFQGDAAGARALVKGGQGDRMAALLARIDVRSGDGSGFARARDIADRDKNNCDALAALSEWDLRKGKPTEAIAPAQVNASQCLDRDDGYLLLVQAYKSLDRTAGVERVYREGIDAHPLDRILTGGFADWLLAQGRTDPAVSAARRLTKAAPSKESTWRLYARVCKAAGDTACVAEANAALAKAKTNYDIDLPPGERQVNPLLGRSWR